MHELVIITSATSGVLFSQHELVSTLSIIRFTRASSASQKEKVKSSMARSLPVENLLPQNVGRNINYFQ